MNRKSRKQNAENVVSIFIVIAIIIVTRHSIVDQTRIKR